MRIAIAHDYLTQRGGAERVLLSIIKAFPDSTVYTLLYDAEATFGEFRDVKVVSSVANRFGMLRRNHRLGLGLYPLAANRLSVDGEIVVASTSGWAHGFRRESDSKMLAYCHNPARWLYQSEEYLGDDAPASWRVGVRALAKPLTVWDRRRAGKVDEYIANSAVVANRIRDTYGVNASVLHPPVGSMTQGELTKPVGINVRESGYLLCVSRLLPYKNVNLVLEASRRLGRKVVVVGEGPEKERLFALAGANATFLSAIDDAAMRWLYHNCSALVGASYEDFGLTPIEAAAFGKPSVVLRRGGYLETVIDGRTGVFFDEATVEALVVALTDVFEASWDASEIKRHADLYSEKSFIGTIRSRVDALAGGG